jgi:hypothetical protein
MAIEDIIQIKESVKENPLGDPQTVNQAEFLRFQEQMGLGVDGIMAKIIQMFVEAPSDFTRQFGVEAADAVREFLGNQTQRELEGQGRVFAPDSAEIIGQKTSFRPDQSAIGTLPTDQADQSEGLSWIKQIQDTLGEIPESATSVLRAAKEDFNPKDYREGYLMVMSNLYPDTDREMLAQEYDNWFKGDSDSEYYEDNKNRVLKFLSNMPGGGAGHKSAEEFWKIAHPDQFDKEGNYIGKKEEKESGLGSIWETIKDKLGWQKWGRGDKESFDWFHGEEVDLEDENFINFINQRWMEEGDTFLDGVEKWKKDVERIIKTNELED